MPLREQKGNMYDFVTHTWNPIKGRCKHNCSYCYMKRFPLKEIRLDEKELKTNLGENNFIFIGSGTDVFCEDVEKEWIRKVLNKCEGCNNTYFFQSKNTRKMMDFAYPKKSILCTTLESNRYYPAITGGNPPNLRLRYFKQLDCYKKMITIEPILDFDLDIFSDWIINSGAFQVNIGCDSGCNKLPEPSKEKLEQFINIIKDNSSIKIHLKKNINRILKVD